MKITMDVIDVKDLDDYIDANTVPFAICVPQTGVTSNRQLKYIEKYYDEVVDKKGWKSYYCNIVNAWKCREVGYKTIKFKDGKEENIKDYNLERNKRAFNGYLVETFFTSGNKINSLDLVKMIRLDVEKIKKQINSTK